MSEKFYEFVTVWRFDALVETVWKEIKTPKRGAIGGAAF